MFVVSGTECIILYELPSTFPFTLIIPSIKVLKRVILMRGAYWPKYERKQHHLHTVKGVFIRIWIIYCTNKLISLFFNIIFISISIIFISFHKLGVTFSSFLIYNLRDIKYIVRFLLYI